MQTGNEPELKRKPESLNVWTVVGEDTIGSERKQLRIRAIRTRTIYGPIADRVHP